ncbi:MAG: pyruvate kinase alpha/beta domain-containing protein [Bacillota bacterium]
MYWERFGEENTEATVKLAIEVAERRGIKNIVVASNMGSTAEMFGGKGLNVVCVTHVNGFKTPGKCEMDIETRHRLEAAGIKVLTTTHVLSGAERAFSNKFAGIYPVEIMAQTLRMFGQGVKVCVEIATMALDAAMIPYGESIIAVGGSSRGADTCLIMKPAHANNILETKIEEIVCKPR